MGDGCLIRIETDAGIVGYGEAGLPSAAARQRIAMMQPQLIGQDPLAIERPYLDNQVLDMIHPDVAYSGGITGCRKIADYAALTCTPLGAFCGNKEKMARPGLGLELNEDWLRAHIVKGDSWWG